MVHGFSLKNFSISHKMCKTIKLKIISSLNRFSIFCSTNMGNNLCKERGDRSYSLKSPVDRVLSRCAQVIGDSFLLLHHDNKIHHLDAEMNFMI